MSFKKKFDTFKKATKEFWDENKTLIIAFGGFLAGTFVTYKIMKYDEEMRSHPITMPQVSYTPPVYTPIQPELKEEDKWDEVTMRDNWDWVCELASNMELEPGESYYIENAAGSHADAGTLIGTNLVEHIVDGEEVYPDDVEDYEDMYDHPYDSDDEDEEDEEDEDEEDDDKYIEIKVNEDDPVVKDIVRKFVVLANSNSVSVKLKEDD